MTSLYLFVALALLLIGIVGSIVPSLPGPLFSVIGVFLYWWSTGYSTPGPILFGVIIFTGIFAIAVDYIATYIGADKSGASQKTALMAGIAAGLLFLFTGPFGIIIGVAGVVFLREIMLGKDSEKAFQSSITTTMALLSSIFAKVALTFVMLLLFLLSLTI